MKLLILAVFIALAGAQQNNSLIFKSEKKSSRRSYVCPPNFVRLSHRCYYFSKEAATWQDAYFQCRDLHSNLAIIRNANQDKLIRRTLSKRTLVPLERWLGGLYDWEQMTWKWAASGKPLTYQGFSRMEAEDNEKLRWHCIIVDPQLQYKWNTRSCLEEKHFICHTKIKVVTNKGKKKLLKQYNVNKDNQLNEIPVPVIPNSVDYNSTRLKEHHLNAIELNDAEYALKPRERRRKSRRSRKRQSGIPHDLNQQADAVELRRKQKYKNDKGLSMEHIKWKTYYKEVTLSPLHPRPIVEEFNYVKEH